MHLILCVDAQGGLSFCGRRLSRDSRQIAYMMELTAGSKLWAHPYSKTLFTDESVLLAEDFLSKAGKGEYCFLEISPLPENTNNLESVIVYCWNRRYPSTQKLPQSFLANMQLVHTEEFSGSSHENITMQRYIP